MLDENSEEIFSGQHEQVDNQGGRNSNRDDGDGQYNVDPSHLQGAYTEHEHAVHVEEPRLRDLPLTIWNIPRFLLLALIRLYQATFSRALPADTCRFYPTCSHYGYQAIYKYGVIRGGFMATWRVMRCNPFSKGGFDPVP